MNALGWVISLCKRLGVFKQVKSKFVKSRRVQIKTVDCTPDSRVRTIYMYIMKFLLGWSGAWSG